MVFGTFTLEWGGSTVRTGTGGHSTVMNLRSTDDLGATRPHPDPRPPLPAGEGAP